MILGSIFSRCPCQFDRLPAPICDVRLCAQFPQIGGRRTAGVRIVIRHQYADRRELHLLRRSGNREIQLHGKHASLPQFALDRDGASHHGHNHLCYGQPQAASLNFIDLAVPLSGKRGKQVLLKFPGNADARIRHFKHEVDKLIVHSGFFCHIQADAASFRSKFHCISH